MPHAMLVSVKRCRQGLACKAQVALTGSCRCASTGGGAPCGARAQAEKHRTVRKHRRSRQGRTRAWRGHRLSSTGHPGSEREVEGVEARFLARAQAEKHRAVRKPTPYAKHGLRSTVRQARVDKHRATGPEAPGGAPDNSAGVRVLRALTFGARATPSPHAPARTRVWWRRFFR